MRVNPGSYEKPVSAGSKRAKEINREIEEGTRKLLNQCLPQFSGKSFAEVRLAYEATPEGAAKKEAYRAELRGNLAGVSDGREPGYRKASEAEDSVLTEAYGLLGVFAEKSRTASETFEQAFARVSAERPDLVRQHREELMGRGHVTPKAFREETAKVSGKGAMTKGYTKIVEEARETRRDGETEAQAIARCSKEHPEWCAEHRHELALRQRRGARLDGRTAELESEA